MSDAADITALISAIDRLTLAVNELARVQTQTYNTTLCPPGSPIQPPTLKDIFL